MNNLIVDAIKNKKIISFFYDGGIRELEPHCYGITTAQNEALRAFQISGHSLSGGIPDWRLFDLSNATSIKVLEKTFTNPRPGYSKGDKAMAKYFMNFKWRIEWKK